MIRSTLLFTLLLLLSFQGQVVFATQALPDETIADLKASVERLEEFVRVLEVLEELDHLDLFLETMPEGKKSNVVLIIETMENVVLTIETMEAIFVSVLKVLEELDHLDLFLETMPEGKKIAVEDGINDLPYDRAQMGEELMDRIRTVIADCRRLMQLAGT